MRTSRSQFAHVMVNASAFTRQIFFNGIRKGRVGEPVRTLGFDRHQRPCHFVFTLCASFNTCKAVVDSPLQWLVITSFEMQAVDLYVPPSNVRKQFGARHGWFSNSMHRLCLRPTENINLLLLN